MRLIDADALIPMIKYATTDSEIGIFPIRIGFDAIVKIINAQPTIDPEPHWIPCSERLPEDENLYLVTVKVKLKDSEEIYCAVSYYNARYVNGKWLDDDYGEIDFVEAGFDGYSYNRVIAWMPLPEPYKESEE